MTGQPARPGPSQGPASAAHPESRGQRIRSRAAIGRVGSGKPQTCEVSLSFTTERRDGKTCPEYQRSRLGLGQGAPASTLSGGGEGTQNRREEEREAKKGHSLALPRRSGAWTPPQNPANLPPPLPRSGTFPLARYWFLSSPPLSAFRSPIADQGPVPTGYSLTENGDYSHSRSHNNC